MTQAMMLDTNVVIDFLRGRADALSFMESLSDRPVFSSIVVGELYTGVRKGVERATLDDFVGRGVVVPLTADIAAAGGLYRRRYGPSHNVGFNDAMIAATAHLHHATLVTLNRRHFPMLDDVLVPYEA